MRRSAFCAIAILMTLAVSPAVQAQEGAARLTLDQARAAVDAAQAEAVANGWNVTIIIADAEGVPIYLRRMDDASPRSYDFAMGKARTSALSGLSTREYRERAEAGSVPEIEGAVTIEGGLPLVVDGVLVGAIATSGVAPQNDAQISRAGAATLP